MKRSNRLILLIGIFLALIAFVLILLSLNKPTTPENGAEATTTTLVVATQDIKLGAVIQATDVTTNEVPITDFPPNGIKLTSLVVGQIARLPVVSGQAVTTDVLSGASGGIANLSVPAGYVAMAVQVDQVTGVGTIIKSGDYVDLVTGITRQDKIPLVVSPTARPGGGGGNATPAPRNFIPEVLPYNSTTVKTVLQGVQVLGTLLPPPPSSGQAQASPGSGQETTLNGQQQIVVLAMTPQQVEVVKFAQMDGNISLVLRSTEDCQPVEEESPSPSPSGSPAPIVSAAPVGPCPTFTTTGITLRKMIDDLGVIPPQVVEVIQPTPYPVAP